MPPKRKTAPLTEPKKCRRLSNSDANPSPKESRQEALEKARAWAIEQSYLVNRSKTHAIVDTPKTSNNRLSLTVHESRSALAISDSTALMISSSAQSVDDRIIAPLGPFSGNLSGNACQVVFPCSDATTANVILPRTADSLTTISSSTSMLSTHEDAFKITLPATDLSSTSTQPHSPSSSAPAPVTVSHNISVAEKCCAGPYELPVGWGLHPHSATRLVYFLLFAVGLFLLYVYQAEIALNIVLTLIVVAGLKQFLSTFFVFEFSNYHPLPPTSVVHPRQT